MTQAKTRRRLLRIGAWTICVGLLYLFLGPYTVSADRGGFYTHHEVHFGLLDFFVWKRVYTLYGYFLEEQTTELFAWRLAASALLALIVLVLTQRLQRRLADDPLRD